LGSEGAVSSHFGFWVSQTDSRSTTENIELARIRDLDLIHGGRRKVNRKTVSILLTSEPDYDEFAFKYFLLSLNKIQSYYEFVFPDIGDPDINNYYCSDHYEEEELFNSFEKEVKSKISSEIIPDYFINVMTPSFGENLFFGCSGNVAFITTHEWEKYFSPPSLFEYLLHCIIGCLLYMRNIGLSGHKYDTKGCCLDYTYFKTNDRVDIALGYICDECRGKIIDRVDKEYFAEITRMINREWIGNINDFGSVAHNLKSFFRFNINRDSGFNKSSWDKVKDYFYGLPRDVIVLALGALIGILVTTLFGYTGKSG